MYERHPEIDTPSDDTVIWRYMDLPKLVALCSTKALHLCRMDHLRDPWEGQWPKSVVDAFRTGLNQLNKDIPAFAVLAPSNPMRNTFFVSCWHESPVESAALWDQYGNSRGLAVRSTIGRLKRACNRGPQYFVGRVRYLNYAQPGPTLNFGNVFPPAFLKRSSFEHEQEVRVLMWDLPCDSQGKVDWSTAKEYQELPVVLEELIESIYISPECPQWHVEPINQLLQEFGVNVPVQRSTLYDPTIR